MDIAVAGLTNLCVLIGILARHLIGSRASIPILVVVIPLHRRDIEFFDIIPFLIVRHGVPRRPFIDLF
jgi:hypothetical protein